MYLYAKALHIIFVVTWFAALFYIVRLFIYTREAQDKPENERTILTGQLQIMSRRLWNIIAWPSAILTLFLGNWVLYASGYHQLLFEEAGRWILIKYILVLLLYVYHFSLHRIFRQQQKGDFRHSSSFLRMYNEVATLFLFAIVFFVVLKQSLNAVIATIGLVGLAIALVIATRWYKKVRGQERR